MLKTFYDKTLQLEQEKKVAEENRTESLKN